MPPGRNSFELVIMDVLLPSQTHWSDVCLEQQFIARSNADDSWRCDAAATPPTSPSDGVEIESRSLCNSDEVHLQTLHRYPAAVPALVRAEGAVELRPEVETAAGGGAYIIPPH